MFKKVVPLVYFLVFFGLCYFAFSVFSEEEQKIVYKENEKLKQKVEKLEEKVQELNKELEEEKSKEKELKREE